MFFSAADTITRCDHFHNALTFPFLHGIRIVLIDRSLLLLSQVEKKIKSELDNRIFLKVYKSLSWRTWLRATKIQTLGGARSWFTGGRFFSRVYHLVPVPNEENWNRCGMLSVESRYSAECNAESKKEKIEGAEAEATARVWTHKICLPRKKDRRKRNNQWSNRNGRRKVANRNSVVVLQISAVFSFSYLCVYGAPRCALRGHGFVFFLEQGPLTGSRKIGTYLGPLKITLPLLSSLPDLLLSWHVRKTGENFRRQLEASLLKRSTLTISGRLFEFSSHCLAIEHGTRTFTRNASSWIVARKNAAISCRKSRTGPRLCSLECYLFLYYFLLSNGKRNGRSK